MQISKRMLSFLVMISLGVITKSGFAQPAVSSEEVQLQKVIAQTKLLESQMKALKLEIQQLKSAQPKSKKFKKLLPSVPADQSPSRPVSTEQPFAPQAKTGISSNLNYITGSPIVISSYLGSHTAFDASDLIINYASYNESLHLLQLKQKAYKRLNSGPEEQSLPFLMISGKIEGLVSLQNSSRSVSSSSIDLEDAELDIAPVLNKWASGYMAFQYSTNNELNTPPRVLNNSRVHLSKAFLTFGNLDAYPAYFTMGQFNIPFGRYSSSMISSPLTQDIFQIRARAILLGYAHPDNTGLYAQAYAFNGDAHTNRINNINNIGANLGYIIQNDDWHSEAGIGGISNIADAFGFQQTNAPGFPGFSASTNINPEKLQHQVGGLDTHFSIGTGPFNLITEYITASRQFSVQDLTYQQHGARPKAVNIEGNYSFHLFDKPAALSAGYGKSWEALGLALPETRYLAAFTTSIWKDTIEEIEFRHDNNYGDFTTASGFGLFVPSSLKGGSTNTVTAQIGIYF